MPELRCNICDQLVRSEALREHLAGRNHSIKKKVAEFNEMNAQVKPANPGDTSIIRAWIRDLHRSDYLTARAGQA